MQPRNFQQPTTASRFRKGLGIPAAFVTLLTLGACSAETGPPPVQMCSTTLTKKK